MSPRHTVLLIPSNSSYLPPSLSRRQPAPLTPLDATLMHFPASVANKRLTAELTPLTATLTKNEGRGGAFPPNTALRHGEEKPDIRRADRSRPIRYFLSPNPFPCF